VFPEKSFQQAPYTRITKEEYEKSTVKTTDSSVDDECATGGSCPVR
jgi:ribonucleoside-triphosphate reductase (thioredoxin)